MLKKISQIILELIIIFTFFENLINLSFNKSSKFYDSRFLSPAEPFSNMLLLSFIILILHYFILSGLRSWFICQPMNKPTDVSHYIFIVT